MGYRKLATSEIGGLLNRWQAKQGVRQIARETGIDRKTVRRYIAAAKSSSLEHGREPTQEEVFRVIDRVQARSPRSPSESWKKLLPYKELITASIGNDQRMQLRNVSTLLEREGVNVTYWTLRRFAIRARMDQSVGAA